MNIIESVYFKTKKEPLENIQLFERYGLFFKDILDRESASVRIDQSTLKLFRNLNSCLKIIKNIFLKIS